MALGDAYERRDFSSNAVATTLNGTMGGTGAVSPVLSAVTGWPSGSNGPFYVLFADTEIVLVTSRSASTLTVAAGGRGQLGTSAANHASGSAVILIGTSRDLDEANRIVNILGNATSGLPIVGAGAGSPPTATALSATGLASNAVTTAKILDANVTAAKLDSAIVGAGLTGGAGTALAVGAGTGVTVNANDVAVDTTTVANALDGAALTVVAGELAVAVDSSTIEVSSDALRVKADGITASHLAANSVDSSEIAANAIGTSELADNAVDTGAIAASAVTEAKIADGVVSAAKLKAEAWTAYTPTLSGTGVTLGNGTATGAYQQRGKNLSVKIHIDLGSTTDFGSGGLAVSLPAGFTTASDMIQPLAALMIDSGFPRGLTAYVNPTGTDIGFAIDDATSAGFVNDANPVAWTSSDSLHAAGTIEVA